MKGTCIVRSCKSVCKQSVSTFSMLDPQCLEAWAVGIGRVQKPTSQRYIRGKHFTSNVIKRDKRHDKLGGEVLSGVPGKTEMTLAGRSVHTSFVSSISEKKAWIHWKVSSNDSQRSATKVKVFTLLNQPGTSTTGNVITVAEVSLASVELAPRLSSPHRSKTIPSFIPKPIELSQACRKNAALFFLLGRIGDHMSSAYCFVNSRRRGL